MIREGKVIKDANERFYLHIAGFLTCGVACENGDVGFGDGGYWAKQMEIEPDDSNITGTYVDNWINTIVVSQDGSYLNVEYKGMPKEGRIAGNPGCECTVLVATFAAAGTCQKSGDVVFADGG